MAAPENRDQRGESADRKTTGRKTKRKVPNPNLKRGQPTAAGRLISSSYIKYGWHKPLTGDVRDTVQRVSSTADSMYMLQIERTRPIDSRSLRNGIFWEHRQLQDQSMISTPSADHIDLFPLDDRTFEDTRWKISKEHVQGDEVLLHYLFEGLRSREFLLLPIELDGLWVTVIARIAEKREIGNIMLMNLDVNREVYVDREVTDLAILDPVPHDREARQMLIRRRLTSIFAEGCIELSTEATTTRDLTISDIDSSEESRWQTGLIAYAVSREFMRRLKTLQWRRRSSSRIRSDREFLWSAFEEHYNFDNYRQTLMTACALQCIEKAEYKVRLALEVPSEECNYDPKDLGTLNDLPDEKWDVFLSTTHTVPLCVLPRPWANSPDSSASSFTTPRYGDEYRHSPDSVKRESPPCSPTSFPSSRSGDVDGEQSSDLPMNQGQIEDQTVRSASSASESNSSSDAAGEDDDIEGYGHNAPVAAMGQVGFSLPIPGLNLIHRMPSTTAEEASYLQTYADPVFIAMTPTGGLSPPPPSAMLDGGGPDSVLQDVRSYGMAEPEERQLLANAVLESIDRPAGTKRSFYEDEDEDAGERLFKRRR
ncbi:hypothetical protein GGS21DRAFT_255632 [Xylaria nigripes]|nr:hypothetical protein GGS21DRAFT_255632 [Xylaria nigripes]